MVSTALALTVMPTIGLANDFGAQRGMEAPWQQQGADGHGPGSNGGPGASQGGSQASLKQSQAPVSYAVGERLATQRDYDEAGAAEAILQGFRSFGGSINLEAYAVPADSSTLDDLFCSVVNNNPELF